MSRGSRERHKQMSTKVPHWHDFYTEGLKQGRTETEINEEFSELCRKKEMEEFLLKRVDLKTPHKCSASPVTTVPHEPILGDIVILQSRAKEWLKTNQPVTEKPESKE